ncbi:MAG: efflux RND transporter permease subunit [Acidaminococcaceae bacterium]|nr:efflux RND transporter permease subunit [Acidaminococcaceae bacterium]
MIKEFINRPVFTTMFILVLVVFGIRAYPSLGVDLNPEIDLPLVSVTVTYTGAAPEEMETLITKPIENRVSQVSGIKTLSSTMREGYSQTVLEFAVGTDAKEKSSEVREKVASVRGRLPDDIDEPIVQKVDLSAQSVILFTMASESRSRGEIVRLIEDVVKNRLQQVEGVSEVTYYGAGNREFKIYLDAEKLQAYNLPFQTVYNAVNSANENTPGGNVEEHGVKLVVRTIGKLKGIDEIKNIVVSNSNGRVVKLSDVAEVKDDWEEEISYARANMVPSVTVSVRKQSGTNTVAVIDGVKATLAELQKDQLPADIKIDTIRDTSTYIRDNIADVWSAIIFGGFLALLITYFFLQNFRATIIGGMAIPTSVIATFAMMKTLGFTLNNMSLMGISLAVGMLIDDAIVLIENIFRHMEMGKASKVAALDATKELSLAILATSMSLMAVFVPIGTMGEIVGQFFAQFGLTVAFALAFSTISAYSLTPMLSAYWLERPLEVGGKKNPRNKYLQIAVDKFENGFQSFRKFYDDIMLTAINHPKKIILIALATFVLNFALTPFLGVEFQPTYDSGQFSISLKAPSGTTVEQMRGYLDPIEQEIMAVPGVEMVGMRLGGTRTPTNQATIDVKLVDSSERTMSMVSIMDDLRKKFANTTDLKIAVTSGQGAGRGDKRPVQLGVRGSDFKLIEEYAQELATKIKAIPGATDVDLSIFESEPEVIVRVNQDKASRLGLNPSNVGDVVQMAFQGKKTTNTFTFSDNDYDIRVELMPSQQRSLEDVKNLQISNSTGKFVRLADVASVTLESGPTQIDREDRERQIAVYANVQGISPGELTNKIRDDVLPTMNFQQGYHAKFIGESDMMSRSFGEIAKALLLAIIIIYMVLAAEFESFSQPIVIMVSLPLALVGAIIGLLMTGLTVNMMSLIGFTMLLGLVTKNAILLVDYTNQARERGADIRTAVLEACSLRLRPILMTTLSTILGMLPIALGWGAGAELRQSMGVVLVGGMFSSTILTLVVVPLVYMVFEDWKLEYKQKQANK